MRMFKVVRDLVLGRNGFHVRNIMMIKTIEKHQIKWKPYKDARERYVLCYIE